jgi:phosphatidylinositol glycan class B
MLIKPTTLYLFVFLFLFRATNTLLVQTFSQPDEYWQSLEIAHRIAFGYGYETWEWRPTLSSNGGIRSVLHTLLFVPIYYILRILRLDGTYLLVRMTLSSKDKAFANS